MYIQKNLHVKQCETCKEMKVKNGTRKQGNNEIRVSSAKSWELFSVVIHSKQTEMCCIVLKAEEVSGFIERSP